jgi:hypothetical protein
MILLLFEAGPNDRLHRSQADHSGSNRNHPIYSLTKGQQAIRDAFRAMTDRTGNLPHMPGWALHMS